MPTPDTFWVYASTISLYLVVLAVPGGLIGALAGLRGWALAGLAPLLTYTAIGLAGPWLSSLGLPSNLGTTLAITAVLAAVAGGLRLVTLRRGWAGPRGTPARERPPTTWTRRAHLAVIACVVLATALSVIVVLSASGGPSAVFQRWDTVFHANGIRYIAETGDGGLFGMSTVNYYDAGGAQFYPNAYHLVGALVYSLSGAAIPTVLNSVTVPIAGMFALSLVVLIRQFGGRAVAAGCTAIVAGAATTGAYESVSSGLLPFALGIVLTPLAAVGLQRFLKRPGLDTGFVLALAMIGLLALHSSSLFGAILFSVPLLLQRWFARTKKTTATTAPAAQSPAVAAVDGSAAVAVADERRAGEAAPRNVGQILPDLLKLVPVALISMLLAAPHLLGAIAFTSGDYPYTPWASDIAVNSALAQLLTFRQVLDQPQIFLSVILVVGILSVHTLDKLRWVGVSAVLLSALFVGVACFGAAPWVIALSRPWWNDRFRLMALAAIPLCILAGHGLAETQRQLAKLASRLPGLRMRPPVPARLGLASAVLLMLTLAVLTNGFYTTANATAVSYAYHNGPDSAQQETPVTANEVAAMLELRKYVQPGEKVLNDRLDGTAWMYAIAGVRPVAGHYDPGVPPPDAAHLASHFREYDRDPKAQAAVARLNVHHVLLGHGSIKEEMTRVPGLRGLDKASFLRREYVNPDAVIYTIIRPPGGSGGHDGHAAPAGLAEKPPHDPAAPAAPHGGLVPPAPPGWLADPVR